MAFPTHFREEHGCGKQRRSVFRLQETQRRRPRRRRKWRLCHPFNAPQPLSTPWYLCGYARPVGSLKSAQYGLGRRIL